MAARLDKAVQTAAPCSAAGAAAAEASSAITDAGGHQAAQATLAAAADPPCQPGGAADAPGRHAGVRTGGALTAPAGAPREAPAVLGDAGSDAASAAGHGPDPEARSGADDGAAQRARGLALALAGKAAEAARLGAQVAALREQLAAARAGSPGGCPTLLERNMEAPAPRARGCWKHRMLSMPGASSSVCACAREWREPARVQDGLRS